MCQLCLCVWVGVWKGPNRRYMGILHTFAGKSHMWRRCLLMHAAGVGCRHSLKYVCMYAWMHHFAGTATWQRHETLDCADFSWPNHSKRDRGMEECSRDSSLHLQIPQVRVVHAMRCPPPPHTHTHTHTHTCLTHSWLCWITDEMSVHISSHSFRPRRVQTHRVLFSAHAHTTVGACTCLDALHTLHTYVDLDLPV
jgi:hypothetical protein